MNTGELIERFYRAFHQRDAATMGACYRDDASFSDPVFPSLDAAGARAMWAMLTARASDLTVEASDIQADASQGSCRWVARYTFSATGRFVENRIAARFTFQDGLIRSHVDTFDFWRWSRQALGPTGLLLGWSPVVRNKVRATAAAGLRKFSEARAAGAPA
jgi:ketosteroid isomerase-like protein